MSLLIYKNRGIIGGDDQKYSPDIRIEIWRPSFKNITPPGKGRKYSLYWLFYYLNIFKNKDYAAVLITRNREILASLLIVPAYYKWPFMRRNDLQLTYVLTKQEYRGLGYGDLLIRTAISYFRSADRNFWYVTHPENIPSRNLCMKNSFELSSYGYSWSFLKIIRSKEDAG